MSYYNTNTHPNYIHNSKKRQRIDYNPPSQIPIPTPTLTQPQPQPQSTININLTNNTSSATLIMTFEQLKKIIDYEVQKQLEYHGVNKSTSVPSYYG